MQELMASAVWVLGCAVAAAAQCEPEWSALGSGSELGIVALTVFDEDGPGPGKPYLFVGGGGVDIFADIPLKMVARWDGWRAFMLGDWPGKNGTAAYHLQPVLSSQGPIPPGLYAGGTFDEIGGQSANNLARWDGDAWHDVGGGLTSPIMVYAWTACVFDEDGDGPGSPALFVGGQFQFAGGVPADGLARWNGQSWSEVGGGLSTGHEKTHPNVFAMTVYDDGRGPALYAAGSFYYAGGLPTQNIARWDGQAWEALGLGPSATVRAVCAYDEDEEGPLRSALFACGEFNYADGNSAHRIARWDGKEWSAVGGWNASGGSLSLAVWKSPDDDRQNLYMGGLFSVLPDGTQVRAIARWNGQRWRDVDYGVSGFGQGTQVSTMASFDEDGDGPNSGGLYVGGLFFYAGAKGLPVNHIARWGCPLAPRCDADLDHNGTLDLFDFLTFLNLFNADDPAADCDASGSLDLFDFFCFTNAFNVGC